MLITRSPNATSNSVTLCILYDIGDSLLLCFLFHFCPQQVFCLQMDLNSMISRSGCECLNESDDHVLDHALTTKGGYLESDCDEQVSLIILYYHTRVASNFYCVKKIRKK